MQEKAKVLSRLPHFNSSVLQNKYWRKRTNHIERALVWLKMPRGSSKFHGRKRRNDCIRNKSPKTFVMLDSIRDTVYPIGNNTIKSTKL